MRIGLAATAVALVLAAVPAGAVRTPSTRPFAAAIADPARPAEDVARDAERKPAELMAFAGVRQGMKIVELAPGGGYFTRLLSLAVGRGGHVYAFTGRASPAVEAWAAGHPNVSQVIGQAGQALASQPVDMVWTTLNYHDFKNVVADGKDGAARYNAAAFAALKPGGSYLIVDHEAAPGAGTTVTSSLHRIESAAVIREVEAAGFKLAARSDILRHSTDDHLKAMREAPRGQTDQFVLLFRKPRGKR